jgi:hypothetical protein
MGRCNESRLTLKPDCSKTSGIKENQDAWAMEWEGVSWHEG